MNEFESDLRLVWVNGSRIQDEQCLNPTWAEFKKEAINKLCLNPTSEVFFVQSVWNQDSRVQDGCHHQVESDWMSEVFFLQNGWIHDGRVQDGCHHQVESEWMCLSQFELVWVRVLCKMAESKMTVFKMAGIIIKLSQIELGWVRVRVEEECF